VGIAKGGSREALTKIGVSAFAQFSLDLSSNLPKCAFPGSYRARMEGVKSREGLWILGHYAKAFERLGGGRTLHVHRLGSLSGSSRDVLMLDTHLREQFRFRRAGKQPFAPVQHHQASTKGAGEPVL
jgi:hypothetical protein